jgi:hypothetical protein
MRTYLFRYKELPSSNWILYTTYITEAEAKNMFGGKAKYENTSSARTGVCFKDEDAHVNDALAYLGMAPDNQVTVGDVMKRDTSGGFFVDVDKYHAAVRALEFLIKTVVPEREQRDTLYTLKKQYNYEL